jgi:hypothetical protein
MAMRLVSKAVLAGLGVAALAGAAYAAEQSIHVMAVPLADGSVMHIRYFGDKKPQIAVVAPQQQARGFELPMAYGDPLSIDRMFEEMDAQADTMMRQAAAMAAQQPRAGGQIDAAALQGVPAGSSVSYSFTSSSNGQGGCVQSYEMASYGNGSKPQVIEQHSGDCSALAKPRINASATAPAKAAPVKPAVHKVDPSSI